jgi:hypothetical protein
MSCQEDKTPETTSAEKLSANLTPIIQLELYKDVSMTNSFELEKLTEFLKTIPELEKVDDHKYKGVDGFPKMNIALLSKLSRICNPYSSSIIFTAHPSTFLS